jgi:cytochrome c-type biogenesis protein CcmH
MVSNMVARLAANLEDDPDNADGWLQLARSYEVLEQPSDAEAAYARAAALRPGDVNVLALYARSILSQASTDQPLALRLVDIYRRIVQLDAQNPEALYFAGLGEAQAGNTEIAASHWQRLLSMLDPGTEAYGVIEERLDDLRAGP